MQDDELSLAATHRVHNAKVLSICRDGEYMWSGSLDKSMILWDAVVGLSLTLYLLLPAHLLLSLYHFISLCLVSLCVFVWLLSVCLCVSLCVYLRLSLMSLCDLFMW